MDLATEDDQHAKPGGVLAGGDANGVNKVCRPVGSRRAGCSDRAGKNNRCFGVADDVPKHCRLFERVGPVRDDDADPTPGRVARCSADLKLLREAQVGARKVGDGLCLEPFVGS